MVHITGAGSLCTVTASQAGLDAYAIAAGAPMPYYAAPDVLRTFAIAKANQTIDFGRSRTGTLGVDDGGLRHLRDGVLRAPGLVRAAGAARSPWQDGRHH